MTADPKAARLLRACQVVTRDEAAAHRIGALLGKSATTDIADAAVVTLAASRTADIVTSDRGDVERLLATLGAKLRVVDT